MLSLQVKSFDGEMYVLRSGVVLVLALMLCKADLVAQPKFLYGMYATGWGGNEGVSWTGSSFAKRTGPGGRWLMTFWNETLGMDTFFPNSSNFPEGGEDSAPLCKLPARRIRGVPGSA